MMANHGFLFETNATNYIIEVYTMLIGLLIRLPSQLAAQVMMTMFHSSDGKTCYATDLHMEHWVRSLKKMLERIVKLPDDISSLTQYVVGGPALYLCWRFGVSKTHLALVPDGRKRKVSCTTCWTKQRSRGKWASTARSTPARTFSR